MFPVRAEQAYSFPRVGEKSEERAGAEGGFAKRSAVRQHHLARAAASREQGRASPKHLQSRAPHRQALTENEP